VGKVSIAIVTENTKAKEGRKEKKDVVGMGVFIDPRYEWSIFSGPGFQTSAKPTSNWLEIRLLIG
jgi:hypothetical protein